MFGDLLTLYTLGGTDGGKKGEGEGEGRGGGHDAAHTAGAGGGGRPLMCFFAGPSSILRILWPNSSVECVSLRFSLRGEQLTKRHVFESPPSESCSRCVSFELRYLHPASEGLHAQDELSDAEHGTQTS